jgi:hypothetical protein
MQLLNRVRLRTFRSATTRQGERQTDDVTQGLDADCDEELDFATNQPSKASSYTPV